MEKRLDIENRAENALTRQDKTNSDCRNDRQYGQAEPGQHESNIRQRSDIYTESTHRQRAADGTEKVFKVYKALNDDNGLCRTIKSQYYKNSLANFMCKGSWGATAVIQKKDNPDGIL